MNESSEESFTDVNDLLKKGTKVKLVMRCTGIWIASGKFGCGWVAEQVQTSIPPRLENFAFRDDDDDEDEDEDEEDSQPTTTTAKPEMVDDSSDDKESGSEEEAPKRRPVKKKKSKQ